MKTRSGFFLFFMLAPALLLGACRPSLPSAPAAVAGTAAATPAVTATAIPTPLLTFTPTPVDTQALLQTAVDRFIAASSFQMSVHEIASYQGIAADGTVTPIYGEVNTVYDYLRRPELKVHVRSQFRYSPDSDYTGDEFYLFEQNGAAFMLTLNSGEPPTIEETGGRPVDTLVGDAYQAVLQYGTQAQFTMQDPGEVVYILDHPAWYTLQGALGFADLGLLAAQPNGAELVKEYVGQVYPDVQTVRFILHVSIADQVITRVELDNRAFMQSLWSAYRQALIDQGADPAQINQYEILPEHGVEFLFGSYDQVPDFNIPH